MSTTHHEYTSPTAGLLYAKIYWRVPKPDGDSLQRSVVHVSFKLMTPFAGLLYAKINWRVPKPDGDFLQRSVVQTFRQQPEPDMLWNHGSALLANPQHLVSQALVAFRTSATFKHRDL